MQYYYIVLKMSNMFMYFIPQGGFNDILVGINRAIEYCLQYDRILLLDGELSLYKIDFTKYFTFPTYDNRLKLIGDHQVIKEICEGYNIASTYPSLLQNNLIDIVNGNMEPTWNYNVHNFTIVGSDTLLLLPKEPRPETVIICVFCGGGNVYSLFKELKISPEIKEACKERYEKLTKPYISLQIRNTDYQCNHEQLYQENKELIHSFPSLYIATDDVKALQFYKSIEDLNVCNFTSFPETPYFNLHYSSISPEKKITDLICDIYMIARSNTLLTCSLGGFIGLIQSCRENIDAFLIQFT